MAGISFIASTESISGENQKFEEILNGLNYLTKYNKQIIRSDDNYFIGYNKYREYPVPEFETERFHIIIEGKVYNKTDDLLLNELSTLFENFKEESLAAWLKNADGDFVIFVIDKIEKKAFIFNDILGRMPVYYHINGGKVYISRYIKFITEAVGEVSFDRIAFGEYLLLGYLLGERSLFKDIKQLRPASVITFSRENISTVTVHDYNFQNRIHSGKNFSQVISELSELLSKSCLTRLNNGNTNVLALSGGLDSRTIGACMVKNNIPFETVTMTYKNKHAEGEEKIAKQVADYLSVEWRSIMMTPPPGSDLFTLLKLKEGMNYLATAPMLLFYRKISEIYGDNFNIIYGDKSDKITLVYDNPTKKVANLDQLTEYITGEHAFLDFGEVCSRLSLHKDDILGDFHKLLTSYPEQDFKQKYIHFRSIEKSHKLAFQGDDRHKRYQWSYSPLTSSPFITYLFNIPDNYKRMHKIFIGLLNVYSPGIADIIYPNFKAPITSAKAKLFMGSVYYLYPKMPHKLNSFIKAAFFGTNTLIKENSIYYKFLKEQSENTAGISAYLDLSNLLNFRTHSLHNLMTLTSLIEYFEFNKSTFDNYLNVEFDYKN